MPIQSGESIQAGRLNMQIKTEMTLPVNKTQTIECNGYHKATNVAEHFYAWY